MSVGEGGGGARSRLHARDVQFSAQNCANIGNWRKFSGLYILFRLFGLF